ncbi:MAG: TetR/AcrR family transcriptional regulator [Thermodesulfobacteriota bacterium]
MPKPSVYSDDDIVSAALALVRREGPEALSARSLANELSASTMLVYTRFGSMEDLRTAMVRQAYRLMAKLQFEPRTGDIFLDMGVGYVRFAKREPNIFRLLNETLYRPELSSIHEGHTAMLVERLAAHPLASGLSLDARRTYFLQGLVYCHGLAHLCHTEQYRQLSEDDLAELVIYTGKRYMEGFGRVE